MDISLIMLLLVGTAFTFWWLTWHREELRIGLPGALVLAVVPIMIGVVCVKVFAALESLDFSKLGSMSIFGVVFFMPVVFYLGAKLTRRKIATVFDTLTPCMIFTLMCTRINCMLTGCCNGMVIPGLNGLRWPTREAEILFYIVLLAWFWQAEKKKKQPGLYYPVYMAAYGAFRFLMEGFRDTDTGSVIHIAHLWAAVTFCLGMSIYAEMKRTKKTRIRRNEHA